MADTATRLKLLLADDHVLVREGLKRLIEDQPDMEVIAEAGDGPRAIRLAQDLLPDVALVDVSMPGMDGVQVTRFLAEQLATAIDRDFVVRFARRHDLVDRNALHKRTPVVVGVRARDVEGFTEAPSSGGL